MSRQIISVFESYQQSRVQFVQTVAELSSRPQNIESLQNAGVLALLRPLLLDSVPSIQQSAALALGRLASYSEEIAEQIVSNETLPHLTYSLSQQNRYFKKAASFVIRSIAKHSPQLAQSVIDAGALEPLVNCLQEFDPSVKESSAWALGYIARHSPALARAVVDAGAVPLLVLAYQEPELTLKRISASSLADIAKHSNELAQAVVDANIIKLLVKDTTHLDAGLKRQVCACLAQISKHSVDLAEVVVEAELFPRILHSLKDGNEFVRKNAATLIREVSRHSPDLAKLIVNSGGVAATVDYITEAKGNNRLPGIVTLGYIAAFSETLALSVVVSRGIPPLRDALINEAEDHIKAGAAWALGQIGRHSPDHARALAEADVLRKLLAVYLHVGSSEDLKLKSKRALKGTIQKCTHLPALEPLLQETPPNILKHVVHQFAKILPNDLQARRNFVQSGALQKLQEVKTAVGTKLRDYVDEINHLYPPEIVNYYNPAYPETLLKKLDEYTPN